MPKVPVGEEAGLFCKLTEGLFRVPEDTAEALEGNALPLPKLNPVHDSGIVPSQRLSAIYGDRLKILGNGPVTEQHLRDLELLPDSYHKKLAEYFNGKSEGGLYVLDGPVTDVLTHLRGVRPRGWPEGKTWEDVPGATETTTHRVIIGGPQPRTNTALHETGHAFDHAIGDMSHSPKFKELYDKMGTMRPYFRQPGNAGHEETFAEMFSTWAHNRDMPPAQRASAIADALGISVDKKFRGSLVDTYFTGLQHSFESHAGGGRVLLSGPRGRDVPPGTLRST